MRSATVIKKNLKLLLRSKGSALVVLLAPLLIVIIIGIGFTDTTETIMNIGTYTPEKTELTQRFIDTLNTSTNNIIEMPDEERCVQSIQEGVVLACIAFPENFEVDRTRQQEVKFYVDESRLNLVHQLVSDLGRTIDIERTEVSQELTGDILETLGHTESTTQENIERIISMRASITGIVSQVQSSRTGLTDLDLRDTTISLIPLRDRIDDVESDYGRLRAEAGDVVDAGYAVLEEIEESPQKNAFESALGELNNIISANETESIDELREAVQELSNSISSLRSKLEETRNVQSQTVESLDSVTSNLNTLSQDLDTQKTTLETTQRELAAHTGTTAESITQPITTTIESVTTDNRKITFSFPYLLMLVILFVGIMLSSTLVYMEKESKAFFRNFTTPSRKPFLISMTYITSLLVILIQTAIILVAVYYGLEVPILNNLDTTAIIIVLGTTVFILIGMFLGHLFNTFEAITMSTIAIGSVFIFLSNLVLPLETLSKTIQEVAEYNPYVITSESIRKSMIFSAGREAMQTEVLILIAYIFILLIAIVIIQKISTMRYFAKIHHKRNQKIIKMPEDHHLRIPEKNIVVTNIPELLELFKKMSDQEYKEIIKEENIFSNWLKQELKVKMLARRINKKKRDKAIKILENYIKKRIEKEN